MDDDDKKRIQSLERSRDDHARAIGDLQADTRRVVSEAERRSAEVTAAALRHFESIVGGQASEIALVASSVTDLRSVAESTLAINKTQSATLEGVHGELELARTERIKRAAIEELEHKQAEQRRALQRESDARTKRWVAIAGAILTLSMAYQLIHHELEHPADLVAPSTEIHK